MQPILRDTLTAYKNLEDGRGSMQGVGRINSAPHWVQILALFTGSNFRMAAGAFNAFIVQQDRECNGWNGDIWTLQLRRFFEQHVSNGNNVGTVVVSSRLDDGSRFIVCMNNSIRGYAIPAYVISNNANFIKLFKDDAEGVHARIIPLEDDMVDCTAFILSPDMIRAWGVIGGVPLFFQSMAQSRRAPQRGQIMDAQSIVVNTVEQLRGANPGELVLCLLKVPNRIRNGAAPAQAAAAPVQAAAPVIDPRVGVREEIANANAIMQSRGTGPTPGRAFAQTGASGSTHQGLLSEALRLFRNNAAFRVLSNNSISCITLLGTCQNSPLRNTRVPGNPMTHLLYKFLLVSNRDKFDHPMRYRTGAYNYVEVQNITDFRQEIYRQVRVYNKMYRMTGDPNVPNIVYATSKMNGQSKQILYNHFAEKLTPDGQRQLQEFTTSPYDVSVCIMEYMEGYMTLHQYIQQNRQYDVELLQNYVNFELMMLTACGVIHTDAHHNNVMINPNMPNYYGQGLNFKIIIIDFGYAIDIPSERERNPEVFLRNAIQHYTRERGGRIDIRDMVQIYRTFIQGRRIGVNNNLEPYTRLKPYLDTLGRRKSKKRLSK
jgi:hypothetical protein